MKANVDVFFGDLKGIRGIGRTHFFDVNSEFGYIRASRKFDLNQWLGRFPIKLTNSLSDLVRGNADDGIVARIVVVSAFEDPDPIRAFLQLTGAPRERLVDDVAQESLAAAALKEDRGQQHRFEF